MTEEQVACCSIPLSPKKQEGQLRGQAQPSMPGDGIVPHGDWRIQLKKILYWRADFCAPIGDLHTWHRSPTPLS